MASPDRHFAAGALFTETAAPGTPNANDVWLYPKSDKKFHFKDDTGAEFSVGTIAGTSGTVANAIIRASGTGGGTIASSDINVDDATTSTQNNVAIRNDHTGQTNSALVLTPKGTGALILGPKPDGTVTGGNARGANSVDLQTIRATAAARVCSGARSAIIGGSSNTNAGTESFVAAGQLNNISAGNYNVAAGYNNNVSSFIAGFALSRDASVTAQQAGVFAGRSNQATGTNSVVLGGGQVVDGTTIRNVASNTCCAVVGGIAGVADRWSMHAHSGGRFAADGDAQRARFVLRNRTTTNAAVELFLNGSSTRLTIPSGKYLTGTINIAGIKSDGTAAASYIRQFSIKNFAGTTSLVGTVNTVGTDEAASTSISITADDTNDALKVEVTGITSETWRWVAAVDVVEVAYGA
jgi:hypothetical protein